MTIRTLTRPCWVLQWTGYPVTDAGAHYDTAEAARKAINGGWLTRHKNCGGIVMFDMGTFCTLCDDEAIGDCDRELLGCTPALLPHLCWVAECDCDACDDVLLDEEDSGYLIHRPTEAAMITALYQWRWRVATDGRVYAEGCITELGTVFLPAPPPTRSEQEDAGQLTLDSIA